ncbi:hypothetical protein [Leptolyngbya sp. FACHB-261]|uniref:hypothetical protein n=1 Tax=Leptolyngbya sp. FACHB-261 TaxID=2692806 RepID=UPI0016832A85|nr:hypothetical protein [Leptolyngbya sp. FACHB-261]MBD2099756.1 hypothetical protein [Leptolyngbya sp. FACHB-261]
MSSRSIPRFLTVSFVCSLLLLAAAVVFAYLASPLRDSTFQANSANAGTLTPWLQGMGEEDWLLGATVLATLLATNLTLVLYQWKPFQIANLSSYWQQGWPRGAAQFMGCILWLAIWALLLGGFWFGLFVYLLNQWLLD